MKQPPITPQTDLALVAILSSAAEELARLAGELERLQDGLSDALLASARSPDMLRRAQALDHVFQHAAQLGAVLDRAAKASDPDWRVLSDPILTGVTLSALAGRMSGTPPAPVSEELELW